ncbi:MAG: hypothetical protein V4805_19505 [Pseudomonadota bacterium]
MTNPVQSSQFMPELERQLDQLIAWAVANAPDKSNNLTKSDFAEVRETFCKIANGTDDLANQRREPSQGGAQYINVTPAPWP